MKINSSILRTYAKSPFLKGAALLTSLVIAASAQVKADTITNYDFVDDVIGDSYIAANSSNSKLAPSDETNLFGSRTISGEITAWDAPGGANYADLTLTGRPSDNPNAIATTIFGTAVQAERQFNFSRNYQSSSWGIYGAGARRRNFRIYSSNPNGDPRGPSVAYSNVTDGGVYSSIPTFTLSNGQVGKGFTGSALSNYYTGGINLGRPVNNIYLSLERLTDGLYWSGTAWSNLRTNRLVDAISNNGNSSAWRSIGWPEDTELQNGQYRLRTMATDQGLGQLNTITFTVSKPAPTYFRIRNRWASSMYMYDGGDIARYNTLQSSAYSQSPASFEWELLAAPVLSDNVAGYLTIKNHATGDILHVENLTGVVQCTNVPSFYTSSMWKQTDADAGYKRFENRKQFGNFFRLGYSDGQVHYDSVPANDITAHWSLEPVSGGSAISSSAAISQPSPSGGAS